MLYQLSYLAATRDPSVSATPEDGRDDSSGAAETTVSTEIVPLAGVAAIDGQGGAAMLA